MFARKESLLFAVVLAVLVGGFFHESLFLGKILSPADTLLAGKVFRDVKPEGYEPRNRLLIDAALQFEPWLEFNREQILKGKLPLWNDRAGCGAPHLANIQTAVFDPFHLVAYALPCPMMYAFGWIAAARLWVAGLGMFALLRYWGLGGWGRWFGGLTYPFCGFIVFWLEFPVTWAAIWLPWLIFMGERAFDRADSRSIAGLAIVTGLTNFAGHIQTSALCLLAAGPVVAARVLGASRREFERESKSTNINDSKQKEVGTLSRLCTWILGIVLGVAVAAAVVIPFGFYLSRSPVWEDRAANRASFWAITPPKVLDSLCTAVPFLYGSQRRGDPNLARVLGVRNVNEAAGGFAGLACLVWLAPAGFLTAFGRNAARTENDRKNRNHHIILNTENYRIDRSESFYGGSRIVGVARLGVFFSVIGFLAAFDIPPAPNLIRIAPVVNVMDQRRFTLWIALGLILAGSVGIDAIGRFASVSRGRRFGLFACFFGGILLAAIPFVGRFERVVLVKARGYYARAAAAEGRNVAGDGALKDRNASDRPIDSAANAERQTRMILVFLRRSLMLEGLIWFALGGIALQSRRARRGAGPTRALLLGVNLLELILTGYGTNPAIERSEYQPSCRVMTYLKQHVGDRGRVTALGAEAPPNTFSRYGLADARNYDSIELSRSVSWFDSLYEHERGRIDRSSRRVLGWAGVYRTLDRLRDSGVCAIVASSPPPDSSEFTHVEKIGSVWIADLAGAPLIEAPAGAKAIQIVSEPGRIALAWRSFEGGTVVARQTFDRGMSCVLDGVRVPIEPYRGVFMSVRVPKGTHRLVLSYDPVEARIGIVVSTAALGAIGALGFRRRRDREAKNLVAWSWNIRIGRIRMDSSIPSGVSSGQP